MKPTTTATATKQQLRNWVADLNGELADALAHNRYLRLELRNARKCIREIVRKFPKAYPEPCEFHTTICVTSAELKRWRRAIK